MAFPWTCLALAEWKATLRKEPPHRDLERLENAPRSPAGTQNCDEVRMRAYCVLHSRERKKATAAGRKEAADAHNECIDVLRHLYMFMQRAPVLKNLARKKVRLVLPRNFRNLDEQVLLRVGCYTIFNIIAGRSLRWVVATA